MFRGRGGASYEGRPAASWANAPRASYDQPFPRHFGAVGPPRMKAGQLLTGQTLRALHTTRRIRAFRGCWAASYEVGPTASWGNAAGPSYDTALSGRFGAVGPPRMKSCQPPTGQTRRALHTTRRIRAFRGRWAASYEAVPTASWANAAGPSYDTALSGCFGAARAPRMKASQLLTAETRRALHMTRHFAGDSGPRGHLV